MNSSTKPTASLPDPAAPIPVAATPLSAGNFCVRRRVHVAPDAGGLGGARPGETLHPARILGIGVTVATVARVRPRA